jgi:DNA-binding transcriptional ArsR family regulator
VTFKVMTWAVGQRTGSPARKAVLMNLADRADGAWLCWPGQKLIAKDTELGERTVRRALDDLEKAGLIRRYHHRRKDGSWSSDRYVLAGIDGDPDGLQLLADSEACGQNGRRSERPAATAAAEPAATAAGHEPSVTNPHSLPPTEGGGAHAGAHTREADDEPPQLSLVDAPAKPAKGKRGKTERKPRGITEDWVPSDELRAKTVERYPLIDVDEEVAAFVNWHLDPSRVGQWSDYDRAWWNWVRKAKPKRQQGSRSGRSGPYRNPPEEPTQESLRAGWESAGTTGGGNW